MSVGLRLLHVVDHIRHGLNVLGFVWGDLLHAFVPPMDVFPVGHWGLSFGFV